MAVFAIAIFIFSISFYKRQLRIATIRPALIIEATVTKVHCGARKGYFTYSFRGRSQIVNVSSNVCKTLSVGEVLPVYYNEELDLTFMKEDGREDDDIQGMWAAGTIAVFGIVFYLINMRKLKQTV